MHKIFAKPSFLGKRVVFLTQCHSTNDELSLLCKNERPPEGIVVYTDQQLRGRGQRGNVWLAEPSKNILMSLLLRPIFLEIKNQHYLNLIVGLAILDWLKESTRGLELKLKWPNDIYVNGRKLGGVLIENSLKGAMLDYTIVGIGLNLNQEEMVIPEATSLIKETATSFDVIETMDELLYSIEYWYNQLRNSNHQSILSNYHESLMWVNEPHFFKKKGELFEGIIRGINDIGQLKIEKGNEIEVFNIKEVTFVR